VPRDFWHVDQIRDALVAERHMGHAVRAYRKHPFHGRQGISQEVMARWLAISQTQLSRIEKGPPIQDLNRLVQWAKTLYIPQELLWFDLPDDGDDVRRRQFLLVGGTATLAAVPASSSGRLTGDPVWAERDCSQWLAWELWQRGESSLSAADMPRFILHALNRIPKAGRMILRESDGRYTFAQPSLIDFFVAQRIYNAIAEGKSDLLATAQTSHDTDQVIRRFVVTETSSADILNRWMRKGATPVLRVNSAGILAKIGTESIADEVITALRSDRDTRHLYLTAVASRVLSMPWDAAAQLVGSGVNLHAATDRISDERIADIAVRLTQETKQSQDGAARWCSIVLLANLRERMPAVISAGLQEALQTESCRENLRAIGNALANPAQLDLS
jgi:transcriptional regulator with XRE-family HTH domain